jgi:hypothetical protein
MGNLYLILNPFFSLKFENEYSKDGSSNRQIEPVDYKRILNVFAGHVENILCVWRIVWVCWCAVAMVQL